MAEPATKRRPPEGITIRHARHCSADEARRCTCQPAFQAQVFSPRDRRTIRKSFKSLADARAWRSDTKAALQKGTLRAPTRTTLAEAADDWLAAARAGIARTRSGDPYKPSALRSYEQALNTKVLPDLGHLRLSAVDRVCVQDSVDRLVARGLAPSTVRNSVLPLRAIFRRAVARSEVVQNPTLGLSLPAVRGLRDRVARPEEARALIAAVSEGDRAVWATALYAGLRRGELQALRWSDLDLAAGLIRVERSWDPKAGPIEPQEPRRDQTRPARQAAPSRALSPPPTPGWRRRGARPRERRARLRLRRRHASRAQDLDGGGARADRPPRVPPHLRRAHDRRGGERQGAVGLHGPLLDHDHPRPLRAPDAGL